VELAAIWKKYRSRPIPLSLDTEVRATRTEFTSQGPRFVQDVLQGIDPDITIGEIETALRKVLGGSRVRKSARR
jgi:hypothetical protein